MKIFWKDPDEVKDYGFDWQGKAPGPWLAVGDTITGSTWTVTPAGLTSVSPAHDDTTTTVRLSGGVDGAHYTVVNQITTANGLVAEDRFQVSVRSN